MMSSTDKIMNVASDLAHGNINIIENSTRKTDEQIKWNIYALEDNIEHHF